MSLEVIDYTERKKRYKWEAGEFTLKPPYLYLVDKVKPLGEKLLEMRNNSDVNLNDGFKNYKEMASLCLKIMKLILEETDSGKLADLTMDNFRLDVATEIANDFFQQFKM